MTQALAPAPDEIGGYRIRGVLGRGGMGVVYDAEGHGHRVALKTVLGLKSKLVHAVRREIHALASLKHPGIVAILDEGTHEGAPFYAMEFVEGLTLRAHTRALGASSSTTSAAGASSFVDAVCTNLAFGAVATAPTGPGGDGVDDHDDEEGATVTHAGALLAGVPDAPTSPTGSASHGTGGVTRSRRIGPPLQPEGLPALLVVVRRLAQTLEYLHGRGVVHRDLKPDNVIVDRAGWPVIVDFGLVFHAAGFVGRESIEELALLGAGTASYMAPEQIRGDGVDARADLYSLGVVLYELVCGQTPFDGPTSLAVLNQHLHEAPPPLRQRAAWIPPALDDVVMRLLAKEPADRFPNAAAVAHALGTLLRSLDPSAVLDEPPEVKGTLPVLYRPALAGRKPILDAIDARIAALDPQSPERSSSRGGVVLVVGPSGIGKTRVAVEAARRAAGRGVVVLAGEATSRTARPLTPLRKVLQLVSERCTVGGADKTSTLLGRNAKVFAAYEPSLVVVPGFELFPDPEPLPAPEARRRLLESLRDTLDTLAHDEPLLLIVDDLQWADELTLAFLDHLASTDRSAPFLILGTVRAEEGEDVVEALADRPHTQVLRLDRLAPPDVHAMVDDALGAPAPAVLVDAVGARAGGVPFWVTEVLHASLEARALRRDVTGAWLTDDDKTRALPHQPTGILGVRLRDLTAIERTVVDAACVLGRGARPEILATVAGLDEPTLLDALTALRARHILDDDPDEGIRFTHDKLAEATDALLDGEHRKTLHARAAAALEKTSDVATEALAWHHETAGHDERAAACWVQAGDAARGLSALRDAERCYEHANALFERMGDVAGLAKTLMKLGLVHAAAFDTAGAQRSYQRAFSLWSELSTTELPHAQATPTARVRVTNQPRSLDPARAYDSDSLFVQAQLFEGLVELDVDANVLPAVASNWDIREDGRVYTFHLRENARWSDGRPVQASDFELSWKRTLDPRTRSPVAQLLYVLDGARAYHEGAITDPSRVGVTAKTRTTLEVRLASPSAYLLHLLSHPVTFPIPAHVFFEHGARWTAAGVMVSNGAFVLEERQPLQVRLRRNPLFTGRAVGNIAEIEVNAYRSYKETLEAYGKGRLDILDMIAADASALDEARRRFPGELRFLPLHSTQYLVLRADRPPLDDERVRKALALLIDRDALQHRLAGTSHVVARGGFIAPGVAGHSPELALRADPERAAALFAEAGFTDPSTQMPPLVWLHTHGLGDTTLLDAVREAWSAAGLRVELRELEWDDYERALVEDPPHVVLAGWIADYPDPDTFLRAVFHSVEGAEKIGWTDPRFDELVEQAARTADPRARDELYATADHMLVAEHAVIVPLAYGQNPVLLKKSVRSFPGAGTYLRPMKNVVVDEGTT